MSIADFQKLIKEHSEFYFRVDKTTNLLFNKIIRHSDNIFWSWHQGCYYGGKFDEQALFKLIENAEIWVKNGA